ncbi:endopeptidase La [Gemella morbillorum]|uniref:endopeptidase La n=1 Tax=Gemella morbillorum TaxID=29391 RepID=UPI00248E0FD4|nr:endopeptidase La [Gemella morbillorum]
MTKYYLLENRDIFFPSNTYNIDVTDKKFLKTIKGLKKDKISVFVTSKRKPIDTYDEKFSEDDMFDNQGFNVFFGTYGQLTIDKKANKYEYHCYGVAEVKSGVYNDKHVEYLDITIKNTEDNGFDKNTMLNNIEELFKKYLARENFEIDYYKTDNLEKFINKNMKFFPLDRLLKKRILYLLDLEKKAIFLSRSLEAFLVGNSFKREIDDKVRTNLDLQQKEYFLREQMKVVQDELKQISPEDDDVEKIRKAISEIELSDEDKTILLKEVDRLEKTPVMSPEHSIIRTYLDTVVALPWNILTKDEIDIKTAEKILNEDHYGLDKIKERILEFLAVKKLRDDMKSPILCLSGPPGVGKSSLAKSIARSMGRSFIRISLGGVRDEAEIRGHRRTYLGALPGKIIQSLKKIKTKNPVILLDEIDKMASDIKGDPASAMLEVIDPAQNNEFVDHYLDIPFDLSKVLFIATANNLSLIPAPLRDRMEVIELESYTVKEKENIAIKYLIPRQIKENGLKKEQISFTKQAINKVINGYTYEAGVRNLERVLGSICRKVALKILKGEEKIKIGVNNLEEFAGPEKYSPKDKNSQPEIGLVNGLAYTVVGGDTLEIETSISKGTGKIILTGKLGDVMKESAQMAISYLRSNAEYLGLSEINFSEIDIHLHVPEGAVPKDGPSAGITITTSVYSALTRKAVNNDIAMTGEMTLHGKVLPIGGVKEKILSSEKMNINKIIIPTKNKKDLIDIPKEILEKLTIYTVDNISEVFNIVFGEK